MHYIDHCFNFFPFYKVEGNYVFDGDDTIPNYANNTGDLQVQLFN